ncbi:MAG: alkene reductase [Myxococcales bacterium]|nr:MAG: alkene reductase [Myxococcales bacterium]
MSDLFAPAALGPLTLSNHLVMAPMTRSRAVENATPNALMATYYAQRAGAGLIITEGTATSPDGLGYARIPGLYNAEQVAGWRLVTDAVHGQGGKIFVQFMHTGRIGHPLNLPAGAAVRGPSAVVAKGQMYTDAQGMQDHPTPVAYTTAEVKKTIEEFAQSARLAIEAGLDGIELHGANGYLLEQFLNPASNVRDDEYGGSVENRIRFVLEVAAACVAAIGGERVGIRLSPYGVFNDMAPYAETDETYRALTKGLAAAGVQYIHLVDHTSMGTPPVPDAIKATVRELFPRTLILSGGYDRARAEADLASGKADLIAVGRPFMANPDLVERWRRNAPVNAVDLSTSYTPGPKGYTDYPTL